MGSAYDSLARGGFIGSLKRDVLLEASRDIEYLGTIQAAFLKAGNEAREDAVDCTVKLVQDLMGLGLCFVATWSATEPGSHEELKVDASEIARLVALSNGKDVFTYFVVATKAGEEWVARYHALVNDLA